MTNFIIDFCQMNYKTHKQFVYHSSSFPPVPLSIYTFMHNKWLYCILFKRSADFLNLSLI